MANSMPSIRVLIMVLALPCAIFAQTAKEGFTDLHRLIGEWEAKSNGSIIRVSYRLIASGSALVETFTVPSGRETLTIYHPDGPNLIATHYCAQGNQPRLRLDAGSTNALLQFEFYDATNLADPGASHLKRLRLQILDADHFDKTEIYTEHGKDDITAFKFVRIPSRVGAQ